MAHGQRNSGPQQDENHYWKEKNERESQAIAKNLSKLLARLGKNASHVCSSILGGHFTFLPRFFNDADEYVFEGETFFARAQDMNTARFELFGCRADTGVHVIVGNDVQPVSEQRHTPAF